MKVFVISFAIILAASVQSSPIDDDVEVVNNVVALKSELEPENTIIDDEKLIEDAPLEVDENINKLIEEESLARLINERDGDNIPYVGENDKDNEENEEEEMTEEEKERIVGIEIPLCSQHNNDRVALHLSHMNDCTKFYKCYYGRAYLMDCPEGEHWSVRLDRCDYPSYAKCVLDGTHQFKVRKAKPSSANANVEDSEKSELGHFEIDPRCEGSDPFKPLQLKHPNDCSKFYKCYMGKAYVIKCPKGQQWSQNLNRCEHPQIARCSIMKPAIKPAQAIDFEDSEEDEHTIVDDPDYEIEDVRCAPDEDDIYHPIQFAHPTDCNMFYKCFTHKAFKSQCQIGLHFNEERQYCDYPEEAKCKASTSFIQANVNLPTVPLCPNVDKTVNFPVEGAFNMYFTCNDGIAYLMECEEEELFNPMTKQCQRFLMPHYTDMNLFPMHQYQGLNQLPDMINQHLGINEWQGIPIQPQTPVVNIPQLQNSPQTLDYPNWMPIPNPNVILLERPTLSEKPSHEKPSDDREFHYETGKQNSHCPSVDQPMKPAHLSHETDCQKFYKCFNGRAFLMECPNSQEWSDELQRCDFHQFANCNPVELIKKKIHN